MAIEKFYFDRVLAVRNPASTRANQADQILLDLERNPAGFPVATLDTQNPAEPGVNNVTAIAEAIEPGDVVLSVGGDGLANAVVRGIMEARNSAKGLQKDEAALLPAFLGSSNDLPTALYGKAARADGPSAHIQALLAAETAEDLDLIELISRYGDEESVAYAHGYVGIGATAIGAELLNGSGFRAVRKRMPWAAKGLDLVPSARAILKARKVILDQETTADSFKELTLSLNSQISGGTIKIATELLDRTLVEVRMGSSKAFPLHAIKKLLWETRGAGIEGSVSSGLSGRLETVTPLHLDGEAVILKPGTEIRITHLPEALPVLYKAA